MENITFDSLRADGRLLYEYTRGSRLFGLDTPTSDLDTGGVYVGPLDWFLGLGDNRIDTVQSEKNDDTWSEVGKWITQITKSSPEVLESLFVPPSLVLYKHPIMDVILERRDEFLTQACFKPFANYAISQIKKATGQNKAMMIDPKTVERRKTPLEFCTVSIGNGSTWTLEKWLRENGLEERLCGLVRLPNYYEGFALFYDPTGEIGYRGILSPSDPDTTQLRLSSIPKGEKSLIDFQFGINAFSQHCADYKRYHNWVRDRNPERFDLNKGYTYDSKNIAHCVRLITQSIEVAEGKGLLLDRRGIDREWILSIKNHEITYDEIMKYTLDLESKMNSAFSTSKLPLEPDRSVLEEILLKIRKEIR